MRLKISPPILFLFAFGLLACGMPSANHPEVPYATLKARIAQERDSLARQYANATPAARRQLTGHAAARVREHLARDLFPAWYGTPWDFNGVTQTPGKGSIACGYFVTTLLRDAGFRVERARLAQQASLNIIRSLTPRAEVLHWSGIGTAEFAEEVAAQPEGLYVVGLDIHTGFILHDAAGVWFIHASYGDPAEVVREMTANSAVLAQSRHFYLGRVDNPALMEKWLTGAEIATVR